MSFCESIIFLKNRYIRKIENVQIDRLKMGIFAIDRGHSGPVTISENDQLKSEVGKSISQALFASGYTYAEDNSRADEGMCN